jgi:phosphatidylserine/phosphatidylglycerophosphate/cardiolipin synthase-like enzyme
MFSLLPTRARTTLVVATFLNSLIKVITIHKLILQLKGAKVQYWNTKPKEILHAKFTIVDGSKIIIGSANWSSGASENVELIVVSDDYTQVSQLLGIWAELWSLSSL